MPISSAECERSFSSLKRLLNWLRNSMGQERLSDLAVTNIELPSLRKKLKINFDELIDNFANSKN